MSDFTSGFWNWYVIVITAVSIVACGVAAVAHRQGEGAAGPKAPAAADPAARRSRPPGTSGTATSPSTTTRCRSGGCGCSGSRIVFSLVYLVLYPGLGHVPGVLGWTSTGAVRRRRRSAADAKVKPLYDKYLAMDLKQVAADPQARAMGERLFLNNCAQCHGSDAGGARGFPNLRDNDWLYGGDAGDDRGVDHQRPHGRDAAAGRRARRRGRQERRRLRALAVGPAARRRCKAAARQGECSRRSAPPATGRKARATRRSARRT